MYLDKDIQDTNITIISNALAVSEYYDWLVDMFVPYLGRRTLEIGAGIGTISERIVCHTDILVVSDIDQNCLDIIRPKLETVNSSCRVIYKTYKLGDPCPESFKKNLFDSVVIINVLEHVKDDVSALANLKKIVNPGAKLIVFVPALQGIYGTVDKALGHFRRYSLKGLKKTLNQAGYTVIKIKYVNFLGVLGWWLNSRVLKRKVVPVSNFFYFRLAFSLVKVIEATFSIPFGISLLAIAEKRSCCFLRSNTSLDSSHRKA
jgi:2-polyprenyl-3-methyl-5-hydroxy-6-metoxy-1,4-benzoquinol methylase